ncbi:inositol monophosphatase family protein [Roseicyclus persicicus]|uniref:Inositol-1-monophosphatase n=1 Tax=Roseicyclus persicicus TaxID=2650661 RepID=A0A7X6GZK7_9RHOB|nr:inositol monophosphatase family protein [Roseibacterium persicicum]NKX44017.1 inositol monophosphatase [Roseibacterium persicicum]
MAAEDDLALAERLAREAGVILLGHWAARGRLRVDTKRAGDFVSEADRAAEDHLRAGIAAARPGDGWLGEETGAAGGGGRRWIVDPLDGTTNFLRGIGHWAVSVALEEAGVLTVGVVHDPVKDETFAACRGRGAALNGQPMAPADTADLSRALFGTGIPFGGMAHIDDHAADIARLMPRCAGVRRMGAAALDLAYVAAGRLDGFWERRLQPWDIAAGLVLLREAGAEVAGWAPGERPEDLGNVIAATQALFPAFAATVRG